MDMQKVFVYGSGVEKSISTRRSPATKEGCQLTSGNACITWDPARN